MRTFADVWTAWRKSLEPYLAQLEYVEWERCGHYPWLEKFVREEFFSVLIRWLVQQLTKDRPTIDGAKN